MIVGSGAQVLGPVTVGCGARIGANAVVTKDVPSCVTMVGVPAKAVQASKAGPKEQRFVAYGTPTGDIPDPVARALEGLLDEVQSLRARVNTLEANDGEGAADGIDRVGREAGRDDEETVAADPPTGEC